MQRARKSSCKPKIDLLSTNWQELRDELHVVILEHGDDWIEAARNRTVALNLNGRDFEIWQPILAIARKLELGGVAGLVDMLTNLAIKKTMETVESKVAEEDELLLVALYSESQRFRSPIAKEILELASSEASTLFRDFTPRKVGDRLKQYGLNSMKSRGRREYRPTATDFENISETFGIEFPTQF